MGGENENNHVADARVVADSDIFEVVTLLNVAEGSVALPRRTGNRYLNLDVSVSSLADDSGAKPLVQLVPPSYPRTFLATFPVIKTDDTTPYLGKEDEVFVFG